MKKAIVLLTCSFITSIAFTQIRYGVQVSVNQGTADIKSTNFKSFTKDIRTLKGAMAVAELPVTKHLLIHTSLGYLQKGASLYLQANTTPGGMNTYFSSLETKLDYLEMPLNLAYTLNVRSFSIMVGAGPSFGYGLSGKVKAMYVVNAPGTPAMETTGTADAFKSEENDRAGFRRFETSAGALLAIRHNSGFYLSTNYLHGLTNVSRDEENYRSRNLMVNVGFMFKR
ncbi:outer membrane beta-barrel protein [Segetibacter aerophilus]|uniref:Outer membrane protein beta-barrel domain-containing protein n=1 Tax=Segetibacter aerophilus TaxID=670293 RepID=A0A512B7U3_9BACT|nr:outer membrane beta-barrel protein [Segetibacter aerophilus]GEO07887.1 hypothetical protein SAE01_03830 [Segetibacter aerophilus]